MDERIQSKLMQGVTTPNWRDLCRELGLKQVGRREELQIRVLSHLRSDEGSCRDLHSGGSYLLRSLLQSLHLPMPGLRPSIPPADPGVVCICGGHNVSGLVACTRCKSSQHHGCICHASFMKDYECPLCQMRQMEPFEQVIDVVVPATLCATQGVDSDPRPFIYTLETHTKLLESGRKKSLQIRCIRLDNEGFVQHWPRECTIYVNNRPIYTLSPLPASSSRKRKDNPATVKDFVPGSTNTVMVYKQKEDDNYAFGLFLVEQLPADEVYNHYLYEHVLTEESGRAFVQTRVGGSDEVTVLRQPLKCPITRLMPEVPARGCSCLHVQCFDLRAYVVIQEKTRTNKWRCPICFSLVLHITVDRYMLGIIAAAKKVTGCETVEFQPDGDFKLILEEKNEADEEIGDVRRKRCAEVVIEDEPVKKAKADQGPKLRWGDFVTNVLHPSALYSSACYQSAFLARMPDSLSEDSFARVPATDYGKSSDAPIELDEDRDRRPFSDLGTDVTELKKPRAQILTNRPLIEVSATLLPPTPHLNLSPSYRYLPQPDGLVPSMWILDSKEREAKLVMNGREDWTALFETPGFKVRTTRQTIFSNAVTACYLYLDLQALIDPSLVVLALDDPDTRASWDKSVTSHTVAKFRGTDYEQANTTYAVLTVRRSFEELRRRKESEACVEVFAATVGGGEKDAGETLFSLLRVEKTSTSTTLELCYQMDFRLSGLSKSLYEASRGGSSKLWLRALKSKVMSLFRS